MSDMHAARARDLPPLGLTPRTKGFVNVMPGGAAIQMQPTNPLLVKDDVGRAKPSCYDLPSESFSYGRPGNLDVEGAREVSMRWVSHTPSSDLEDEMTDFVALHKKAAAAKVTTARDLKHFREEHQSAILSAREFRDTQRAATAPLSARRPDRDASARQPSRVKDVVIPSDVIAGFAYGRRVRPSTPIHEVISYRFAEKSEKELYKFYTDYRLAKENNKGSVRKIPLTAASRGHASTAKKVHSLQEETKELFKLGKFKKAGSKVVSRAKRPPGAEFDEVAGASVDDMGRLASDLADGLLLNEQHA